MLFDCQNLPKTIAEVLFNVLLFSLHPLTPHAPLEACVIDLLNTQTQWELIKGFIMNEKNASVMKLEGIVFLEEGLNIFIPSGFWKNNTSRENL